MVAADGAVGAADAADASFEKPTVTKSEVCAKKKLVCANKS